MIGFGCIGANMAEGGLNGLLKNGFPWIFVFWCLSHLLKLTVKDVMNSRTAHVNVRVILFSRGVGVASTMAEFERVWKSRFFSPITRVS